MSKISILTIFDLFEIAKMNNGLVTISKRHPNSAQGNYDDLYGLLKHRLKASFLMSGLFWRKGQSMTTKKRDELNRFIESSTEKNLTFSLYEVFGIPAHEQSHDTLKVFEDFFHSILDIYRNDISLTIQCLYESAPMRVEFSVDRLKEDSNPIPQPEISKQIQDHVSSNRHLNMWFKDIAKGLSRIGPYSWFYFSEESFLKTREVWKLQDAQAEC